MPFSVKPAISDIPVVRQDVSLHIWGLLERGSLADVRRTLLSIESIIEAPFDQDAALRPGGVRIRDVPWGDMPSGLPEMMGGFGLSMTWLTQPTGFEPAGSHLSHPGLQARYEFRTGPDWNSYDLIRPAGRCRDDADRIAACLFDLSQRFGVFEALSNHQKIHCHASLTAAHSARTVEALECAAGHRGPAIPPAA